MHMYIFICDCIFFYAENLINLSYDAQATQDHSGHSGSLRIIQDYSGLFRITQANQLNQNIPVNCDRGIDFIICVYGGWGFDKP